MAGVRIALAFLLFLPFLAFGNEGLWRQLGAGGHVVLVRHGQTTPGVGDPDGFRLEDCATQRNLSEEGRAQSRRLGEAFRKRGIPVGRVLSSPWCRCVETARLAFGKEPAVARPLSNLFGRNQNTESQISAIRALIGETKRGENLVLVTHGSVILPLTGVHPAMGEMVVVAPDGKLLGRIATE